MAGTYDDGVAELFKRLFNREPWREEAACRGVPIEVFFTDRGGDTRLAHSLCKSCPVREDCKAAGRKEKHGIWGGVSARTLRRQRNGKR